MSRDKKCATETVLSCEIRIGILSLLIVLCALVSGAAATCCGIEIDTTDEITDENGIEGQYLSAAQQFFIKEMKEKGVISVIPFVKIEGNGNDFILIDEYAGEVIPEEMKADFARHYCDRRFGIGADDVLFLGKGTDTDLTMRIFRPDGSEMAMCGNGIRSLARYAYDAKYVDSSYTVKTDAGIYEMITSSDENGAFLVEVKMPVAFDRPSIPAIGFGEFHEVIAGYDVYAVNSGLPHAIVFVDDVATFSVLEVALEIMHSEFFPEQANVNFVEIIDDNTLSVRTVERVVEMEGSSCATGATAAAALAYKLYDISNLITVENIGGPVIITVVGDEGDEEYWMKGPINIVFYGVLEL